MTNDRIHCCGTEVLDGATVIGQIRNPYLARPHNRSNLCAALAVAKSLDIDPAAALEAAAGSADCRTASRSWVRSEGCCSSTTASRRYRNRRLAALAVYAARDITVILGGHDRGIDYGELVEKAVTGAAKAVICLGDSGERIYSLAEAVATRRDAMPAKSTVLSRWRTPLRTHGK